MEFGLAIIGNIDQNKSNLIIKLSDRMECFFKDKHYGKDIKSITIGIVCVSPQFEQFFKEKKPKYTKGKKVTSPDGIPFTLEDNFEYSIKINFDSFKNANEKEAEIILAKELSKSLIVLEQMKAKIKDFNLDIFKSDFIDYFKKNKLL